MFYELFKIDNNYKLHIVGEIVEKELEYYFFNFIKKNKMANNIKHYGRIANDKLSEFMENMHYVLCTSIFESTGIGIVESMATGIKPIIFNFPGAENLYPKKWLFMDTNSFINNILNSQYNPKEYNKFVLENYSIKNNIGKYYDLIIGE